MIQKQFLHFVYLASFLLLLSSCDPYQKLLKGNDFDLKYEKAKEYYNSYVKLSDSIVDAERNILNKFEKLKYDSEKNREDNLQLKITNSKKDINHDKKNISNQLITFNKNT